MQLEHIGLNIENARAMVAWWRTHCGMPIHVENDNPLYVAFFGEAPTLLEVYDNPAAPYLRAADLHHLSLHIAVRSADAGADRDRLLAAGATHLEGEPTADGHGLIMLRCPWGLPLQLCNRPQPLITE